MCYVDNITCRRAVILFFFKMTAVGAPGARVYGALITYLCGAFVLRYFYVDWRGVFMITTFIRTFILYILVLFSIRVVGKNGLSSTDPFQIVMMLMIAEIASIPIESPDSSIFNGIAAIVMILFIYALSEFFSSKSERFKLIINGKPALLIDNGAINFKELNKSKITVTDLMEMLRLKDAPSIADVLYACIETNGELSVILKPEKSPVTREDMKVNSVFLNMPCILVSDGNIYEDNFVGAGITKEQFETSMRLNGVQSISDVLLCFCDEKRQLHFYMRPDGTGDHGEYIAPKSCSVN